MTRNRFFDNPHFIAYARMLRQLQEVPDIRRVISTLRSGVTLP